MPVAAWIVLSIFLLLFAWIGFSYMTRGTPVSAVETLGGDEPPAVDDPSFARLIELHTRGSMTPGHEVEVFINGDQTYPRLWKDLRSAKSVITMQMYYMKPGRMAEELREILIERARAGVMVLFLRDAFGSNELKDEWFEPMIAAGVRCEAFRPVHWYQLHKFQHRSHIRIVVIDGSIAWTGGFGIDDKWYGDGRSKDQWRDTNVRFTGPSVAQHQAIFADGWAEPSGELLTGAQFFPNSGPPMDTGIRAGVVQAAPTIGSTIGERLMALPIACARRTLYITNSYFVPDDDFRKLLCKSAERGVDVRVLTCGEEGDVKSTWYAGRARYEALLSSGVRVYEYQPAMMHAKSLVADGCFATVGTLNFDNRSMAFNDESNLIAWDGKLASTLEKIFHEDLKFSKEIELESFRKRPLREKAIEQFWHLFSRLL